MEPIDFAATSVKVKKYFILAVFLWTTVNAVLLGWGVYRENSRLLDLALHEGRTHLLEDHALELWIADHAGTGKESGKSDPAAVYDPGPMSRSPRLSDESFSGIYNAMLHRHELHKQEATGEQIFHTRHMAFTEGADLQKWQYRAIDAFANGEREYFELDTSTGKPILYLSTLISTRNSCLLSCHKILKPAPSKMSAMGIAVPLAGLQILYMDNLVRLIVSLGVLWFMGMLGMTLAGKKILNHIKNIEQLNLALHEVKEKTHYSKVRFQAIFNSISDGVAFTDLDRRIIMVNQSFTRIMGYSSEEVKGKSSKMFYTGPREFDEQGVKRYSEDADPGSPVYEIAYRRKDGSVFMSETLGTKVWDEKGKVIGYLAIIRDITERFNSRREIEKNRQRLEVMLQLNEMTDELEESVVQFGLEQSVYLTESEVGYFYFIDDGQNDIGLFTWSSHLKEKCTLRSAKKNPIHYAGIWADCIRTGSPVIHNDYQSEEQRKGYPEGHIRIKRHMSVPLYEKGKMIAIIGVGNKVEPYNDFDVQQLSILAQGMLRLIVHYREQEEKSALQSRLQQAEKMEALGTLAGGIAHDFNNILGIILGNVDMAIDDLPEDSPTRRNLDRILQAAVRAKSIIKQILLYSRQAEMKSVAIMPCDVIRETLELMRATVPVTVKIEQHLCTKEVSILADRTQFQQMLMNLIVNSVDAMDEQGSITVNGELIEFTTLTYQDAAVLTPGEYFFLSVSDTGIGMEADLRKKIFDPFFTTKKAQEGTGLGLATVRGIVENHGGTIDVSSRPGQGTTFYIYFPISQGKQDYILPSPSRMEKEALSVNERILFVDDEEMVAEMGGQILERQGYRVTALTSGWEALALFRHDPDAFDLVITDQTMPDITGLELAASLLKIRPQLPIILCTGFSRKVNREQALKAGISEFLHKPLDKEILSRVIRTLLEKTDSPQIPVR